MYFDSLEYARTVVNQLLRQARAVFIVDIPKRSHSADHLLYDDVAVDFIMQDADRNIWRWDFSPGLYDPYTKDRFNIAIKRVE